MESKNLRYIHTRPEVTLRVYSMRRMDGHDSLAVSQMGEAGALQGGELELTFVLKPGAPQ